MANTFQSLSHDLLIEELDQAHEITEEELATASIATTCTCEISLGAEAEKVADDSAR